MKVKTKSSKVNRAWLYDHVNDPYVRQAQRDGYRARAVYKLQEIDEALGLVKPGVLVVDLGSAPGAWSQYLRRKLAWKASASGRSGTGQGLNGCIIALDILPMEPIEDVIFLQGDFREDSVLTNLADTLQGRQADLVVSDMAPNLSGIDSVDTARVEHLVELALDFSRSHLKPDGVLVAKVFHSGGYAELVRRFRDMFDVVKPIKPKASRDRSAETFLVGIGLKSDA